MDRKRRYQALFVILINITRVRRVSLELLIQMKNRHVRVPLCGCVRLKI